MAQLQPAPFDPRGMCLRQIDELADVMPGISLTRYSKGGGATKTVRVIRSRDLDDDLLDPEQELEVLDIAAESPSDRFSVLPGDVLVTARGSRFQVALVPLSLEGALATSDLLIVRPRPRQLLGEVLLAYLRSQPGRAALQGVIVASTATSLLTVGALGGVTVPVPSMEEQARLACLLRSTESGYRAATRAATLRRRLGYGIAAERLLRGTREAG